MTFPTKNYPGFVHRHVPAGDTDNLSVRYEGAPSLSRRPYIGEPPAKGFPENPPGVTYPVGTTFIGFGEDVESKAVNRALYALHCAVDSLADRPRYVMHRLVGLGAPGAPVSFIDTADGTWGPTSPSNDQLVYLGPPGTQSSEAQHYVSLQHQYSDEWLPFRDEHLDVVSVLDIQDSSGLSLYPLALPGPGYFPDGKCGKVLAIDGGDGRKIRLQEVDVGGPDTDLITLAQLCLFNYSRLARLGQTEDDQFWKAFAVVESHVAGAGNFLTARWDLSVMQDWQLDDVVYLTTIALTPRIEFDRPAEYDGGRVALVFGTFDRVSNRDEPGSVCEMVREIGRPRDRTPPFVVRIPGTPALLGATYGFDPFAAMFRAPLRGDSVGFPLSPRIKAGFVVDCEQDSGAGNRYPGYGFVHLMAMEFAGDTILDRTPFGNEFQPGGGAGKIDLLGGKRWLNPGTGDTDLIIAHDMVEVYDKTGGTVGKLLGTYFIQALDPAGTIATLLQINGTISSAELPAANGYVRLVRPIFTTNPGIAGADQDIPGMATLIGTASGGTSSPALRLIDGEAYWTMRGYMRRSTGSLLGVFTLRKDGHVEPMAMHIGSADLSFFPLFSLDEWEAEVHLDTDRRGSSGVVVYDNVDGGAPSSTTDTGFAAFLHLQPVEFNRATILSAIAGGNPCTCVVPPLLVLGGGKQWGSGPDTDLFVRHDLVEFTDSVTKDKSLWTIHHFIDDFTAQLIRVDGDQSGVGLTPAGTCRVLRPRLHQSGDIVSVDATVPVRIGDGLRLHVAEPVASPPFPFSLGYVQSPGLSVYCRDWTGLLPDIGGVPVGPDKVISIRAWAPGGYYNEVIEAFADGDLVAIDHSGDRHTWKTTKTFYHQVPLGAGRPTIGFVSLDSGAGQYDVGLPGWHYMQFGYEDEVRWVTRYNGHHPLVITNEIHFQVNLPQGATVTNVELLYRFNGNNLATKAHAYFVRREVDFATPAVPDGEYIFDGELAVGTVAGLYTITVNTPPLVPVSPVIDNETYEYTITLFPGANDPRPAPPATGFYHEILGVRVTYTMDEILMP